MKQVLLFSALFVFLGAMALWAGGGFHLGWTKTKVEVTSVDEITGIEMVEYEETYIPGVDHVLPGFALAGALGIAALFVGGKRQTSASSNDDTPAKE